MARFPDMPVCISVPARPEAIHVLRTMVVGAGADAEVPVDALDDLALAVHEVAVGFAISGATRLDLGVGSGHSGVRVAVGGDVTTTPWPAPGWRDTLAGRVVVALVDEIEHLSDEEGVFVVLTIAAHRE